MKKSYLGQHILADFYGCEAINFLKEVSTVKKHLEMAAIVCESTIVDSHFRQFEPYGVSGVVIIAESHIAIHTWPEYGYASIDFFSCNIDVDINKAIDYLKSVFKPKLVDAFNQIRGLRSKVNENLGEIDDAKSSVCC